MATDQWKPGLRMVEAGDLPGLVTVATLALIAYLTLVLIILLVATKTVFQSVTKTL
jgi:hypothetical protein